MRSLIRFALAAGTMALATAFAPAHAMVVYAPDGSEASMQGGGEAFSSNTIVEGISTLTFDSIGVSSRTFELQNTLPATLTLPSALSLTEGAGNNGLFFSVDFNRTTGPGPLGQTGTIDFVISNTNNIDISNLPGNQILIANFDIDVIASSTYITPKSGVLTIAGTSSTATSEVNYNFSILVPGDPASTVFEPGMIALLGSGMLALGIARNRRR